MFLSIQRFFIIAGLALILGLASCSQPSAEAERSGPWLLSADESGMTYVTIKNGNLGEINTFGEMSGQVTQDGKASFSIALRSAETNNEIREERMQAHLFDTEKFPSVDVTTQIDLAAFDGLETGASKTVLLDLTVSMQGVEEYMEFYVLVTRLGPNKVVVNNKAPLILDVTDFGFADGLEKLRELAGLNAITPVVPVTVSLVFER